MKRCLILVLCLFLLVVGCSQPKTDPREKEVLQALGGTDYNYDAAIKKTKELYEGEELEEMLKWLEEDKKQTEDHQKWMKENLYPSSKLEIQSGFTHKINGDYIYITGRVKNVSNSNISYFEVRVDFKDSNGNVLNSDYTNDGLTLKPNDMREFEIISKWDNEYNQYSLSIGDVK